MIVQRHNPAYRLALNQYEIKQFNEKTPIIISNEALGSYIGFFQNNYGCFSIWNYLFVFLFTVFATIGFLFFICKNENMIQSLLNRSDAARILAFQYVCNLNREL